MCVMGEPTETQAAGCVIFDILISIVDEWPIVAVLVPLCPNSETGQPVFGIWATARCAAMEDVVKIARALPGFLRSSGSQAAQGTCTADQCDPEAPTSLFRRGMRHQPAAINERAGVVAMELALLAPIMALLFFAMFDLGIAAAQYIQSYQAVRAAAAYTQYNRPKSVMPSAERSDWETTVSTLFPGVTVGAVNCNYAPCASAADAAAPIKTVVLQGSFTVTAILLDFMEGTKTVTYESRFQ